MDNLVPELPWGLIPTIQSTLVSSDNQLDSLQNSGEVVPMPPAVLPLIIMAMFM
ncbi:hypothetical protein [Oscillatoria acuminata]|uniref:hypothetical protein n=1 Tax=Oscillatoria acuminata TaxID=118323 RepID=UPI0002DF9634|nr:hypothetical protein [Oscillatoria acuminata]